MYNVQDEDILMLWVRVAKKSYLNLDRIYLNQVFLDLIRRSLMIKVHELYN